MLGLHSLPFLSSRGFKPTPADITYKNELQKQHVKDLWILIASVVAVLTVIRFVRFLLATFFSMGTPVPSSSGKESFPEKAEPGRSGKISWRQIFPAFSSGFRIAAFRVSVPLGLGSTASVTELLFIFGYIATMFILLLIDTQGLMTWFFQDRAAHLASCQLPLIVALAGKNNVISFLTGISHEKLNILHRAAARTCLILVWMHAVCRVSAGLPEAFELSHHWMRWGATSLTAFTLAGFISIRPIRNAFYEFFLLSHIFLIGIFLVGGYLHARDPGYGGYIWPALVIWGLERFVRLGRLLWNNRVGVSDDRHHSTASVELISSDTVRLTLRRRLTWKAGQHAYVVLPTISDIPTEAHPLTIASISNALDGKDGPDEKDVVFLVRGRNGFTGRLRDYAAKNHGSTVPAFIDGPYGCPPDLTQYSSCILIAGGSGVSYTLPLLLDLVHNARANMSSVRRAVFIWSVRDPEHLKWISRLLLKALASARFSSLVIEPRIYITGPSFPIPEIAGVEDAESIEESGINSPVSPTAEQSIDKPGPPLYSALKIKHGRPSIPRILHEVISSSSGSVSVDVAGPTPLSESVRRALSTNLTSPLEVLKGSPSVTLHVESFGS